MKCIIAGSRHVKDYCHILKAIKLSEFDIKTVVSGQARGADRLGERWARENEINLKVFPAEWDKYGRAAGIIRNKEMAEHANALIAIWDGKSRGTGNMINEANKKGLKVYIYYVNE